MTGRVKDHYWEQICEQANDEPWGPEPDELEMLRADAELATERYEGALKEKTNERSR